MPTHVSTTAFVRVVLQRVAEASVAVDGREIGAIGCGFLLFVGFAVGDGVDEISWMAEKVAGLRLFADDEGKMNRTLMEVGGAILVISQFTLYGDVRRGRRPSFVDAAPPERALPLYERFIALLRSTRVPVEVGAFGATMEVRLLNDGPVTLFLDR